jgi:hypothetical protein
VTRWMAMVLVLALAVPARAAEPIEIEAGQPAPFKGSLCDKECAAQIVAKIEAANAMRDRCYEDLKAKPSSAPSLLGAGVALVLGIVAGGAAALAIAKK